VQNVAAAPAMPPAQLSVPPSSNLPINARLVETPSSVLTACGEAVFSINLGSASNVSSTALLLLRVNSLQVALILGCSLAVVWINIVISLGPFSISSTSEESIAILVPLSVIF
jgi:hypothetical protein